jgi:hypothetical protein
MRRDRRFETQRVDGLCVAHLPGVPAGVVAQAIDLHRASVARGRDACLKWGPGSSVSRVLIRGGGGELDMAVKGIAWRGLGGALSDLLHGSRARRALAASRRLARAGLPQAEVLAVAERRRLGVVRESFVLTRFLHADPLPVALAKLRARTARRRALLRALGESIGALHAAGLDHRDLKHSNLLIGPERCVAFLDLEALGRLAPFGWRRRVRALGVLESFAEDLYDWLPARERLCFLRAYLTAQPALLPRKERFVREVRRQAARRAARWAARPRDAERHFPLAPRDVIPCSVADAVRAPGELARGERR